MHKSTGQLDMFDIPDTDESAVSVVEALLPPGHDPLDDEMSDIEPVSLCLHPSASICECRECWERHPELWSRYITRANCVRHTR